MDQEILNQIEKTAKCLEDKLQTKALTKEEIEEINRNLDIVLARLGTYKRFFKRLS